MLIFEKKYHRQAIEVLDDLVLSVQERLNTSEEEATYTTLTLLQTLELALDQTELQRLHATVQKSRHEQHKRTLHPQSDCEVQQRQAQK